MSVELRPDEHPPARTARGGAPREYDRWTTAASIEQARKFDLRLGQDAARYDRWLRAVPVWHRRLRRALPFVRGPRVLDVSCGTGFLMSEYDSDKLVTGVDYSPTMLAQARKQLCACGITASLVLADAGRLPFADGSFDCLVNTDAFTLYPDGERVIAEFHRVLAPGGRLILMEANYPARDTWLGRRMMLIPRLLRIPLRDFDALLQAAGFAYEDIPVGLLGILHMYVADKPAMVT